MHPKKSSQEERGATTALKVDGKHLDRGDKSFSKEGNWQRLLLLRAAESFFHLSFFQKRFFYYTHDSKKHRFPSFSFTYSIRDPSLFKGRIVFSAATCELPCPTLIIRVPSTPKNGIPSQKIFLSLKVPQSRAKRIDLTKRIFTAEKSGIGGLKKIYWKREWGHFSILACLTFTILLGCRELEGRLSKHQ